MKLGPAAGAALLGVLLAAEAAVPQEPPPAAPRDTSLYHLAPVTVSAVRPRASPGGASAVEVLLDSASRAPAPTLEKILRAVPLVVVRANSRGEVQPALRGGEDRHVAVLVDGVPITLGWDHRTDLSVVPATAARSLTLHRGLSSLLFGPNAVAGAVEVDIARGGRADAAPAPLQIELGGDHTGARSASVSGGGLVSGDGGQWLFRAGGGHRGSDGAALPRALRSGDPAVRARMTRDGDLRLNTDLEAFDGFLSLRRVGKGGAWGSLTGTGYRLERGVAPEAHTAEPRLWRYPYQARFLGALAAGTGMRETRFGRGDVEVGLGADLGRTEIDEYGDLDYRTVVGGERDDDRTLTLRLLADHTLGSSGDLRTGFTYGDITHEEVIGAGPRERYRQRIWSLAGETEWRLRLGVPVRWSAGVAADGAETPESADKPALGRLWDWAARTGATTTMGPVLVHASGGRRARFPALRELYSGALGRFLANPRLRPEVGWSAELGGTWRHDRGELQLVAFHQRLDDAITRVTVATPDGNRLQRVNLGGVDASGAEILGHVTLAALSAGGGATLQRSTGRDAAGEEAPLEYEPRLFGSAWIEAPIPGRLRGRIEAGGATRQRYLDVDRGAFGNLAPTLRVDVLLAREFAIRGAHPWRTLEAAIALDNVGDRPIFDQAGLPQPGRTLRLQARLR